MTSASSLASLLVLALAAYASASPTPELSRHQKELQEHYLHLSYIDKYSCHHPQARSVPVHELLSPYQTRGKAYFPEYTVLHRCDVFAGCCQAPKKCGPLHAESLHLPFKVTYLEDMGEHQKGQWEMEYVSFDNHTECGCLDRQGLYKPEVHKDHHKEDHEHRDHEHKDHEHRDHEHKDHEHRDHEHKDHEHKDQDHKYPHQDEYPSAGKDKPYSSGSGLSKRDSHYIRI